MELLVIVAAGLALIAMILPQVSKTKRKAQQIDCVGNLKQIGIAFRLWSHDNLGHYPMTHSVTNGGTLEVSNLVWRTFQVLSNELGAALIIACPGDLAIPEKDFASLSNTNISYFIGLDAAESQPEFPLAGDRNLQIGRKSVDKMLTIRSNDTVSWFGKTHLGNGSVALSDGSVQVFTSTRLQAAVTNAIRLNWEANTNATLRLAMPE